MAKSSNSSKEIPMVPSLPKLNVTPNLQSADPPVQTFADGLRNSITNSVIPQQFEETRLKDIYSGNRYPATIPGMDYEEAYAQQQSGWDQAVNGTLKGVSLAATTIAGGFAMLGGIPLAIATGDVTDIWDNEAMRSIDEFNHNMDQEWLKNYYTKKETDAEWWSTDNWLTTNFIFDKLVKNSGYAVGAMYSGNIANAGLLKLGQAAGKLASAGAKASQASNAFKLFTPVLRNTSRAFSQGRNIEAAGILEKQIKSIAELSTIKSELGAIAKTTNNFAKFGDKTRQTLVATYASGGEASFEALQTGNEYRESLIEQYKEENFGNLPDAEAMVEIDEQTKKVGKTAFFGNMALLGLTEFQQLKYLAGSTFKNSKRTANDLVDDVVKNAEGKWVSAVSTPKTKFGKLWKRSEGVRAFGFDPKEAAQELGQFALSVGTQNYFNKANESDAADWYIDGVLYGFFGKDEEGEGVGALNSKEGIEGGILGGITGGMMQGLGKNKSRKIKAENTEKFLSSINNAPTFKEAFEQKIKHSNRAIVIQGQEQEAILSGDELEAKDLKYDAMHNYLMSRIKFGRFDMVLEDLSDLQNQGMTEVGLADLKAQGYGNVNDTIETFQARLNTLQNTAKNLESLYNSNQLRFGSEILKDENGDPLLDVNGKIQKKYSPEVLEKLTYAAGKISNYDLRIPQVNAVLTNANINTIEILENIIENGKPNEEAVDAAITEINKNGGINKDLLKTNLSDLIELSLRRKAFLEEYDAIKNKPLNFTQDSNYSPGDYSNLDVTVSQKIKEEGKRARTEETPIQIGRIYSLAEPVLKEGNQFTVAPKLTVVSQTLGGELEVRLPNGKLTFLTPTEFKKYQLIAEDNTSQELADILDASIDTVLETEKFAEIKEQANAAKQNLKEGEVFDKVGFVNELDNKAFSTAVVTEYNKKSKQLIEAEAKKKAREQRIAKRKEELKKLQESLGTNFPLNNDLNSLVTSQDKEDMKLSTETLFISSTTESEDLNNPNLSAPHLKRARTFLNNIDNFENRGSMRAILVTPKNAEALGLKGIVQMSYGVSEDMSISDIPYDVNNVDTGFVAQVFVTQEDGKTYFINEAGEKIKNENGEFIELGSTASLNEVIFQTMPTTELTWNILDSKTGEKVPKYRQGEEALAKQYSEAWRQKREQLFSDESNSPEIYKFQVSQGIPKRGAVNNEGEYEKNHVGKTLVKGKNSEELISTQEGLLVISTTDSISHNNKLKKVPSGIPILKYGEAILQFLSNKKFSNKEATTLFKVIDLLVKDVIKQSESNQPLRFNREYIDFLENVLYWKKGQPTGANQIRIEGNNLELGNNSYPLTEVANFEKEIIANLQEAYNSVNNVTLTQKFNEPFTEFYLDKNGELTNSTWENYQTYLLSSKWPTGSARPVADTPLTTTVAAPTLTDSNAFKQRHSTLEDMGLKVTPVAPKPPAKKQTPVNDNLEIKKEDIKRRKQASLGQGTYKGVSPYVETVGDNIGEGYYLNSKGEETTTYDEQPNKKWTTSEIIDWLNAKYNAELDALESAQETNKEALADNRKYDYSGSVENSFEIPNIGVVTFTVKEGETPVIVDNETTNNTISVIANNPKIKAVVQNLEYFKDLNAAEQIEAYKSYAINVVNASVNAELKKDVVQQKKEPVDQEMYNGIPVIESEDIKNTEGKKGAAQYDKKNNLIKVNRTLLKQKFQEKAWTNMRELVEDIDGQKLKSFAENLPENQFNTYEEFEKFVIEHEYQHSIYTKKDFKKEFPKGTIGEYETAINNRALDVIFPGRKPEVKPKPTGNPFTDNKPDGPSIELREAGKGDVVRMNDAELELFKEWHAKNLPLIPFEILEKLISINSTKKAWGVFENGVAKFVKGGLRGTEYHEIFEAIYAGILSKEEQKALIDEFRAQSGTFVDRVSGKKYSKNDPAISDKMIKERIADDFADYRVGKLPARSLGEKVRNFFKQIMNFFKSFVTKPTIKEELFKAIDSAKFKDVALSPEVYYASPEYREDNFGVLTASQVNEFIQDMVARSAGILYAEGQKELLFSPERITSVEMFNKIAKQYSQEFVGNFTKMEILEGEAWENLKKKTKNNLRTLGINFNENDLLSINAEEANKNNYAPGAFSTDWKKNSTGALKFSLASLLLTEFTNQSRNKTLKLPKPKLSSVGGYQLLNFSKTFATMLDKLSNTSNVDEMVNKLFNLSKEDGDYVRTLQLIGANLDGSIDFSKFNSVDWKYFIQFTQTFTKQKPEALIQYQSEGETYTAPASLFSIIKVTQEEWVNNMKALALESDSLLSLNKATKKYVVNTVKLQKLPFGTAQERVDLLKSLGINFSLDAYSKLKTEKIGNKKSSDQERFNNAVGAIRKFLGSNNEVLSLSGKVLDINGPLSTLAELYVKVTNPNQENTHLNIDGERMNNYAENNTTSIFENEFNESETLEELLEKRPELKDMFSKNSQVLKLGGLFFDKNGKRIRKIEVRHIEGTKLIDQNKNLANAKLSLGKRFTQEMNQNINGNYYILIPADGSTEWMMNLGNNINFSEIEQEKKGWNKIYEIFNGYLNDDIAIARDHKNRSRLKNVKPRAKELRFFNEILFEKQLTELNNLIANKENLLESEVDGLIEKYLSDNQESINESIKNYIDINVSDTRNILEESKQIKLVGENTYSYNNLDSTFSKKEKLDVLKLSDTSVNNIIRFANVNYIINNIEYHKILFGDPFQFKIKDGVLDETKRIKSFLSPRRTTFDSVEFNNFLKKTYNNVKGVALKKGEPGYQEYKSYTNTVTVKDNMVAGSLRNVSAVFGNVDQSDAMSWLMDGTYKEISEKNGQWSPEAEAWHQWQMAYTRQNASWYSYSEDARGKSLAKLDESLLKTPEPKNKIAVLKPIVSGNKYNSAELILDKFSQMPIYFSMVEGTNMEKLYEKMLKENIGYAIVESGRKVGIEKAHSLYNGDGSFNNEVFAPSTIVQVPWKAYGIQLETLSEGEKFQTRGSQLTKLSSMDLFSNGVATSEAAKKEYERNTDLLNKMHENAYKELLNRLGIQEVDGEFVLTSESNKTISETLMFEMLRREASDNTINALELDEFNQFKIPFEAAPSYVQIRNIIYSMIDKAVTSPKMSGGPSVQVAATMFETATKNRKLARKNEDGNWEDITTQQYNALSDEQKKSVMLTDDTLKFYKNKDGARYCEIMLPHWFKRKFGNKTDKEILDYLDKPENESILRGIGFRIPTQALSSIEVFKVKGFLPQYMGSTVVVPSEITMKAGSDFDIDKLNMYLKSVHLNENGEVKLIQYKGSEEVTKDFYSNVYDKTIQKSVEKIVKNEEFRTNLLNVLDKYETSESDIENTLSSEELDFYYTHEDLLNTIDAQAEKEGLYASEYISKQIDNLQSKKDDLVLKFLNSELREEFVKEMYKKSLENAYYDSLEKLITLPENFERLISPIDDAGLKALSIKLNKLKSYDETNIKNRLLNRNYMTNLRNSFLMGKKWVGIAAVNITNLSLKQKSQVYIDPTKFKTLSEKDAAILGNGKVILNHNTTDVNGEKLISLSGTTTADKKQLISNRLSGYATAFVDIAKDDFITKIIQSDLIIGTFMFLENIGAGEQGVMFLNQPIINEYLKLLNSEGAKHLFNADNIDKIKSKFVTTNELLDSSGIDLNNLESNIENYYSGKLNEAENAEQIKILDEFLKYAKMAEFNFKFTQATNYDTSSFRSAESLSRKQYRTKTAENSNIISSVNNILNTTFIGPQALIIDKLVESMGSIFKLDAPKFKFITDEVLRMYSENDYMSANNFDKIANKVKASFLDYIIQTNTTPKLNSSIKTLLVDANTSVASKLEKLKEDYPNLKIGEILTESSGNRVDGAKSIKLKVKPDSALDEDLYVAYMRELRDYGDSFTSEFFNDLVNLSILQGVYESPISIRKIIPIEDYSKIIKPIIDNLVVNPALSTFKNGYFQKNNFRDEEIMPYVTPKFFVTNFGEPIEQQYTDFGDIYADIFSYYSSMFPTVITPTKKFLPIQRRVMLLSEKYNSFDLSKDFVKIPRVVTDRQTGESIDMMTGKTVTKLDYVNRKRKGDPTLNNVYGYQKVYYNTLDENGNKMPLTTLNKKGEVQHVYKMINLLGDGYRGNEYYEDSRKSVIDNGSVKIAEVLSDEFLIELYGNTESITPDKQQSSSTQESSEVEVVKPKGSINVYWGQAESKTSTRILSNLAPRKFIWEGREYGSVEHAYQSNKSGSFSNTTYMAYTKIGGYGKKIRGRATVAEMKAADSLGLMKQLVVESFKQNPNSEAAKKLMKYENFTHNTNQLIDQVFLEGLKLAQKELSQPTQQTSEVETGQNSTNQLSLFEDPFKSLPTKEDENNCK